MSDMVFGEPLGMLEDGEYVPWVQLIFGFLKLATRLKAVRYLGPWIDATLSHVKHNVPSWVPGFCVPHQHHSYIARRVDKRLQTTPTHPDIWSLITKESSEDEKPFSMDERYSIANEMMIGGTETTATALSGVIYYLLLNPKYLKELTQELRQQYKDVHALTMQSLQNQQKLNAVLWEGLRVYPPLPTGLPRHVPSGGTVLEGYYLPDDARVAIYHRPTYRQEAHFHLPNEFRPERWLGDEEFKDDKLDSVQPFSVGPRNCIGRVRFSLITSCCAHANILFFDQNFAWHEMRLLLATVLLHFDLKLLPESEGWHEQKVFVVWEKRALMCELIEPIE
jgi:cytochrome P450